MAQTTHLLLKINGQDIKGESSISNLERKDTIECTSFSWAVETPREGASSQVTGRRIHRPVAIVKRVDKSSPVLFKALCRNEKVDSAKFSFFRPNPSGNGEEEMYMTIELTEGYISAIDLRSEDATRSHSEQPAAMEEVRFVFKTITETYTNGGVTHTDSWSGE
jgi:type VI secretion system secreted protein Hcp